MTPAAWLWVRVLAITAVSLGLLVALAPAHPPARVPLALAIGLGACSGASLFIAITRTLPRVRTTGSSKGLAIARLAFFGLWAVNEEVMWRRVALGELLRAGAFPALVTSTVAFAFVHRTRRGVHLVTGGAFGAVYLTTGLLAASVTAHWAYNALVAGLPRRKGRGK